jgi:hypothetical protein
MIVNDESHDMIVFSSIPFNVNEMLKLAIPNL